MVVLPSGGVLAGVDSPLDVELVMAEVPSLGGEAAVEWTVVSRYSFLKDVALSIRLPNGVELVEGSLTWKGDLARDVSAAGVIRVKAVRPGNKRIRVEVFARVDEHNSFSDVDQIFFHTDKGKAQRGYVWDVLPHATDTVMDDTGEVVAAPSLMDPQASAPEELYVPEPCPYGPGEAPEPSMEPQPAGLLTVTGKWYYYDRSDVATPIAWVYVELLRGSDNAFLAYSWIYDNDGTYTFPAVTNPGSAGFKVRVKTWFNSTWAIDGDPIRVVNNSGNEYTADTSVRTSSDGTYNMGTTYIGNGSANEPAWWVMMDLIKCFWWPYWYDEGHTKMAGGVTARWYVGSTDGNYCQRGGEIRLTDAAADVESIPMHEFGHAVQWDIYGGWLPTTGCPSPHYIERSSTLNCAWVEGFASWYKSAASGVPNYQWPGGGSVSFETPTWGTTGWDDGDTVEGRVTCAMWDIMDSNADGYDTCQLEWKVIWDVVHGSTHRDNNFPEFWTRWKNMSKPKHHALKALYQSTIDYNTWPTFSGLPDRTMNEDATWYSAIDLWGYASDAESYDSELTFAITGNTNSNCGVSIYASRYLDIVPAANWNGISDVTITCSDGIRSRTDTLRITVNAVADAPTISGLPDKTLAEDGSLNNTIDLWAYTYDPETPDSGLTFTIVGNTNSNCGVSIGSNRYISINPVANWNGYSDVTVRATDPGGLYGQDTFRITVTAVNDPPVISALPDRTMNEDATWSNAIDLWAYASDVETGDSGLTFTITGNTNPSCGVTITSNRYININPVADWNGVSDVTVRVTDPQGAWDEDAFRITVNPVNDPPVLSPLPFVMAYKNQPRDNVINLWNYASDVETPDSGLTFTITANSNPSCGVTIDSNQYIDVNPAANWTGSSMVTVRVTDPSGAWDEKTFEVVVGDYVATIQEARNRPNGSWVILQYRPVTASFSDCFYVQDNPSRAAGIRVSYHTPPAVNKRAWVVGQMNTYYAERVIEAHYVAVHYQDEANPPAPLLMTNATLGGSAPDPYTVAVPTEGKGLYNIGLLARTTGEVKSHLGTGGRFLIGDGSSVVDYALAGGEPWMFVESVPSGWRPPVGTYVSLTGISGASTLSGQPIRKFRPRSDDDIKIRRLKAAYLYSSDDTGAVAFRNLLNGAGAATTTVLASKVTRFDFSTYHVVIIGADTEAAWTDPASVSAVVGANLPVVAVGRGGTKFLDAVTTPDLYIGWLHSAVSTGQTKGIVVGGDIYSYPFSVPYAPGDTVSMYNSPGVYTVMLYDPNHAATDMIGAYSSAGYYPVAGEGRFYMWGFEGTPSVMTGYGKNLFVNLVYRALRP